MFEQLKIKVAVRQSIIWGVVLVIALFLVFAYNVVALYREVDKKLAIISDMRYYKFLDGEADVSAIPEKNRDTSAIFVSNEGKVYLSDANVYDSDTVNEIIKTVLDGSGNNDGYLLVGSSRVAYKCTTTSLGEAIYLCDYTDEYNNLIRMMIITIVAGSVGIIAIALISEIGRAHV